MLFSRSIRSFSGALVLAVVTSGCSDPGGIVQVDGGSGSFGAAVDNTVSESVRMSMETVVTLDGGKKVHSSASGVRTGTRSSLTFDYGDSTPLKGLKLFVVTEGNRQFLRYGGMPKGSPIPEGWIELNVAGAATAASAGASLDQYLEAMKAANADVKDLGTKKVDGAMVHQYSTVLDLFASAQGVTTSNRVFSKMLDGMKKTMSKVPARIDVDDHERIVRIVTDQKSAVGATHNVITLSDFGGDFDVSVPTDATLMTVDEFVGLVYPEPTPGGGDAPAGDPSDLIGRDDFIEMTRGVEGFTDKLAGCVYDELKVSRPSVLTEKGLSSGSMSQADKQAAMSAGTVCASAG